MTITHPPAAGSAPGSATPIYTAINTVPASAAFSPEHLQILSERAVDPQLAADAGLRSVDAATAAQLLGRSGILPSGGLAIPYPGVTPSYTRVRMDAGDARYLAPADREVPLYVPPQIDARGAGTLFVVEAALKAMSLASSALDAVAVAGVGTTLEPGDPPRLNTSWSSVSLSCRNVVIVFDSNRATNPLVAHAEARLAVALESAGAHVTVAQLPEATPGQECGPDDYIAAMGPAAFCKVLSAAVPADPVVRLRALEKLPDAKDRFAALLGDFCFLAAVDVRGAPAEVMLAASPLMNRMTGKFSKAMDRFKAAMKAKRRAAEAVANSQFGSEYMVSGGCLAVQTVTQHGVQSIALCNFDARIIEDIKHAGGKNNERSFAIEGTTDTGEALPRIDVRPAEFLKGTWPTEKWGATVMIAATRDAQRHLPLAIQRLSTPVAVTVHTATGWIGADGQWGFAHAGGVVMPRRIAPVEVRLEPELGRFRLPDRVEELAASARFVEHFAELVADGVGLVLLAAVFRAPLFEARPVPGVVFLLGATGHRKTAVAVMMQSFFGEFTEQSLPASWLDTPAALEHVFFMAKDCLVVADDVAPKKSDSSDEQRAKASFLIRAVGNVQGRRRMRADMTAQPTYPPRSVVVVTGEDMPAEQSIVARALVVPVGPNSVDLLALTALQDGVEHLPIVMRGYLEWLAPRLDAIAAHDLNVVVSGFVRQFNGKGAHARTGRLAAEIMAGLTFYLRFATEAGLMTREFAHELAACGVAAAEKLLEARSSVQQGTDPVRRFLEVAADLVWAGELPIQAVGVPRPKTERPAVAWFDAATVYFNPSVVFRLVVESLRKSGQEMPLTERALFKRLVEQGVAEPEGSGHNTVKRAFAESRVLKLDRSKVEDLIGSEFPETPAEPRATGDSDPAPASAHQCDARPLPPPGRFSPLPS